MTAEVPVSAMVTARIRVLQSGKLFLGGEINVSNFPQSMIIPKMIDRREDNGFEDWLTAAVIGNTNQRPINADKWSSTGLMRSSDVRGNSAESGAEVSKLNLVRKREAGSGALRGWNMGRECSLSSSTLIPAKCGSVRNLGNAASTQSL